MTDKNPTGRATEAYLDSLHNLTGQALVFALHQAIQTAQEHPGDPDYAVPPQLIATATRYLTANKIDSPRATKVDEDVNEKLGQIGVDLDDEILGGKHTGDARH